MPSQVICLHAWMTCESRNPDFGLSRIQHAYLMHMSSKGSKDLSLALRMCKRLFSSKGLFSGEIVRDLLTLLPTVSLKLA